MQEILRDLIQSYSTDGTNPQQSKPQKEFKFYSNLSITQPIQKHTDIYRRISNGIDFLEKVFDPKSGFQSRASTSRKLFVEQEQQFPSDCGEFPLEIYTSILALDLLGDGECFEIKFSDSILKALKNFILPDCGISTFNLFKNPTTRSKLYDVEWEDDVEEEEEELKNLRDSFSSDQEDQGISSIISDNSSASIKTKSVPDDCNTTALAVALLLREGILDIKPAASITEFLLSNNNPPSPYSSSSSASSSSVCLEEEVDGNNINNKIKNLVPVASEGVIRTFLNGQGIDAITCANVLYLYYLTDMNLNYQENVESTEIFLLQTLKKLLAKDNEEEGSPHPEFMLHHSPDALLFFLSRTATISTHASNRFTEPLIGLLDKRIGQTSHPLDLSLRLLTADALGLLTNDGNWIRRKIEEDYETLVSLQNADGSWPADSLFKICSDSNSNSAASLEGDCDVYFGGRELSTIFACKALDVYYESMKTVKIQTRLYKDYVY